MGLRGSCSRRTKERLLGPTHQFVSNKATARAGEGGPPPPALPRTLHTQEEAGGVQATERPAPDTEREARSPTAPRPPAYERCAQGGSGARSVGSLCHSQAPSRTVLRQKRTQRLFPEASRFLLPVLTPPRGSENTDSTGEGFRRRPCFQTLYSRPHSDHGGFNNLNWLVKKKNLGRNRLYFMTMGFKQVL